MSVSSLPESRICRECGVPQPLDTEHFRQVRSGRRDTGKRCWTRTCKECEREKSRDYYQSAREYILAQQATYLSKPEAAQARKAYISDYCKRNRRKLNHQARERHRLIRARQRAPIPYEVVKPFLDDLLVRVFRPIALDRMTEAPRSGHLEGVGPMAEAAGVDPRGLKRIMEGKRQAVSQRTLDRLAAYSDFTVEDLVDRACEWALLTNDQWPRGYYGSGLPSLRSTAKVS